MQRTHSLTSLSSSASNSSAQMSSARLKGTGSSRQDLSTGSLLADGSEFARKSRKHEVPPTRSSGFNFPNGEVFTPRLAPSRRVRPARLPRSSSMVSVASVPLCEQNITTHGGSQPGHTSRHSGSFLNRSHSFNNIRQKSKQDLVHSLRNTKIDTPTNINVRLPSEYSVPVANIQPPQQRQQQYAPPHGRSLSLTNNRYIENTANIVRSESLLPSSFGGYTASNSNSNPSSISNYNLNRSDSNTPQTSVSGSEAAAKIWSSSESVSSFRTARDPSPLSSIEESTGVSTIQAKKDLEDARERRASVTTTDHGSPTRFISQNVGYAGPMLPLSSPTSLESVPSYVSNDEVGQNVHLKGSSLDEPPERKDLLWREAELLSSSGNSSVTSGKVSRSSVSTTSSKPTLKPLLSDSGAYEPNLSDRETVVDFTPASSVKNIPDRDSNDEADTTVYESPEVSDLENDDEPCKETSGNTVLTTLSSPKSAHKENDTDLPDPNVDPVVDQQAASNDVNTDKTASEGAAKEADVRALVACDEKEDSSGERVINDSNNSTNSKEHIFLPSPSLTLSERRNKGNLSILTPSLSKDEQRIEAPKAIHKGPLRGSRSESDIPRLTNVLKHDNRSPVTPVQNQSGKFSERVDNQLPVTPSDQESAISETNKQEIGGIHDSALYSPLHVDRFLADDQEAVPPRGDVAVRNGSIKIHKRSTSSVSSINSQSFASRHMSMSPREQRSPYSRGSKANRSTETLTSPQKISVVPADRRFSMLSVVDVDYEKLLPPTPQRDFFSKDPLDKAKAVTPPKASKPTSPKKTEKVADNGSNKISSPKKGLKKLLKLIGFGSKQAEEPSSKLSWKSSMNSMRAPQSSVERKVNAASVSTPALVRSGSTKSLGTSKEKPAGNKKREFLSNLKLTTGFKVYDLPTPAYNVRERTPTPDRKSFIEEEKLKYDLPEFSVENDSFGDVLRRFREVEEKIENEVRVLRKSKSIHDFFLKDDELSKAQIFDLQKNDNFQSTDSLPAKLGYESRTSSEETLDRRRSEKISEFPQSDEKCSVVIDRAQVRAALEDPQGTRNSYLRFLRQFADFDEMNVELSGFDPTQKVEAPAKLGQKVSSLSKGGEGEKTPRNVKFANSIAISETYAPYFYKRNNKSVTQYYITEFSEINRIKNELNAYKCYEMLVHEKSQKNTHFFY